MRPPRPLIFVLPCALLLAACAAPGLRPVTDPEVRVQTARFSVLPPSGPHWKVEGPGATMVLFAKFDPAHYRTPQDKSHTLLAFTLAYTLPNSADMASPAALRRTVEFYLSTPALNDSGRYKVQDVAYEPFRLHDTDCLRYEAHLTETNNPRLPGLALDMTSFGVFCRHPTQQHLLVESTCSERLPAGHPTLIDAAFRAECWHMIDSLEFPGR